jgi:hypothetical protein
MLPKIVALLNLAVAGYYIFLLCVHTVHPGDNVGLTRVLMFACLATIPLVFMLALVGGHDRWPAYAELAKSLRTQGPLAWLMLAGMVFLLVVMPLGMLVAVFFGMGLKGGTLLVAFFVPMLLRLIFSTSQASVATAVSQALLYFGAFFAALAVVAVLNGLKVDTSVYEQNVQAVWPRYGDAAPMFFAVCLFALANQVIEFRHALLVLLEKP